MLKLNSGDRRNRSRRGSQRRRQRGAAMIEFALSWMTFFLVAIVGIMDFGRAIWAYNVLAHASHEGVRYAIVRGGDSLTPATQSDVRDFVRSRALFLESSSVQVNVTWEPDNSPGNVVQIQTQHTFEPLMAFMLADITLSSTARMVITQ